MNLPCALYVIEATNKRQGEDCKRQLSEAYIIFSPEKLHVVRLVFHAFQTCFEWFTKGISDLDQETRSQLFQKELLKLDSAKLSCNGK